MEPEIPQSESKSFKKIALILIFVLIIAGTIIKNPFSSELKSDVTVDTSVELLINGEVVATSDQGISPSSSTEPSQATSPETSEAVASESTTTPAEPSVATSPESPGVESSDPTAPTEPGVATSPESPILEASTPADPTVAISPEAPVRDAAPHGAAASPPLTIAVGAPQLPLPVLLTPKATIIRMLPTNPVAASASDRGSPLGFYEVISSTPTEEVIRIDVSPASVSDISQIKLFQYNPQTGVWNLVSIPLQGNAEVGYFYTVTLPKGSS